MKKSSNKKLFAAAESGNLEKVRECLASGADIHADNEWALRWASMNGQLGVVQYLAKQGADIHAENEWALRWTAANGHLDAVRYLVERGADIYAENVAALQWAAINNHLQTARYLIACGADFGKIKRFKEWKKYVDKKTFEELLNFAGSLREKRELKELAGVAPVINVRLRSGRL